MRSLFGLLVMGCAMVLFGWYAWNQMRRVLVAPAFPAKQASENAPGYTEQQQEQQIVGLAGPLANYMAKQEGSQAGSQPIPEGGTQVETLEAAPRKPNAAGHVAVSVVGSTIAILHRTFRVHRAVQLEFAVPPGAATPRLRGTYQSLVKQAETGDADANIELLVLNEQQYSDFLSKRAGEATFSADDARAGEVNVSLPPTIDQAAKYHLVFRNNSRDHRNEVVQADFRMEF